MVVTGWSWDYIEDTVTFDRLRALRSYLRSFPPTHVLVQKLAIGLGVHKHDAISQSRGDLKELTSMFPGGKIA